jgi:hypothetical protein
MQQINVIVTPKAKQTISVEINGVAMSVVNSDGSYSTTHYSGTPFIIPDTIIKNTEGTTILVQPSATSTGVIADSVVTNSDNTFSLNVPAERNPVLDDITHIDSDLTPVVLPAMTPMVCTLPPDNRSLNVQFLATYDDNITFTATADEATTWTTESLTNVATIAYEVNGVADTLPITLVTTDTLKVTITRTNAALDSKVKLTT